MTHNSYPKVTYSCPWVTYSDPKLTYSVPKVTHSDPTHLPLPPPASPGQHQAISQVVGGKVATNFSVSSRQGFKL